MKHMKRLFVLAFVISLLCMASVTVYAYEVPDTSRNGSISVAMTYDGEPVSGGTLTLYQVGEIYEDGGNYSFVLTEAFADSGVSLDNISSSELAETLAEYASGNGLTGRLEAIGEDGTAVFEGLPLGLYLVVQTTAASGYEAVSPFLVSVPANENGGYYYDVDATPKVGALTAATPAPAASAAPSGSILPQTGQLNWPVPVLAVVGMLLFSTGWALRFGRRDAAYEA